MSKKIVRLTANWDYGKIGSLNSSYHSARLALRDFTYKAMLLNCTIKKIQDESGDYWMGFCPKLNISIAGDTLDEVFTDLPVVINDILESSSKEGLKALGVDKVSNVKIDITVSETLVNLLGEACLV